MEQFNELKNTVHGAWLDAIWGEDADMMDCHMESLRDQISGYTDMSIDDADFLGIDISDADMDAWHNFINQCAKEFLVRWDVGTRYPDADTLTIADIVSLALEGDGADLDAMVDSYLDR